MKKLKKILDYIIAGKGRVYLLAKKIIPWNNFFFNAIRLFYSKKIYNKSTKLNFDKKNYNSLKESEFKLFSQNGEDGIIDFIFHHIGFKSKKSVEIGFGYIENNSLFLITKYNFNSLLIDGQDYNVNVFNKFNRKIIKSNSLAIKEWITTDNINQIISNYIDDSEVDLLSIDIDGNDYWIWESIKCISPRVVIMEYNASFYSHSITVPYDESFDRTKFSNEPRNSHWYHGASLSALEKLGKSKGYSLIGTDSKGVNCFFVKDNEIDKCSIEKVSSKKSFTPHYNRFNGILTKQPMNSREQFEKISDKTYIRV